MIDDDIKFFRQNFSASSLSDLTETPRKLPAVQTKKSTNRLNVPVPRRYGRQAQHKEEEKSLKSDVLNTEIRNFGSKASQFKVLHQLKTEHQEIKHLHPQSQQQSVWMQQSERGSEPQKYNKFKSFKPKQKRSDEVRGKNSRTELESEHKEEVLKQRVSYEPIDKKKGNSLQARMEEKQRILKRMKSSEYQVIEQYKFQINHLTSEIDKLVDQNTRLKKDLISKELENKQLKEDLKKKQSDPRIANMDKELQLSRTREKEYLQTIRSLQDKSGTVLPPLPNIQMVAQINYLKQALNQKNNEFQKKLEEALEKERKQNMDAFQKILNDQIAATPRSQGQYRQNFQTMSHLQTNQFMRVPSNIQTNSAINYPNITLKIPQQRDKEQQLLDKLVEQIQFLRRPHTPVEDQLKNIKDSLKGLLRKSDSHRKQFKDLASIADSLHMVGQLQNLKLYIMQQQNIRNNYVEQITFYKNLHKTLSQQNKQYKSQVSTLRQSLDVTSMELHESNRTVIEQRSKLQQKSRNLEQLANSLANIQSYQSFQASNFNKLKVNVDKQRNKQLEAEVERLRSLLQSQTAQLNNVYDDKLKGMQHHINNQEKKIQQQQEQLKGLIQKLIHCETQLRSLNDRSGKDIALLRQANQRLQLQNISYKGQLTSVATNNHQLQTQVKQRTHTIDHLWLVKQAQFDNVMGQLARLRQGFI